MYVYPEVLSTVQSNVSPLGVGPVPVPRSPGPLPGPGAVRVEWWVWSAGPLPDGPSGGAQSVPHVGTTPLHADDPGESSGKRVACMSILERVSRFSTRLLGEGSHILQ